MTLKKIIVCALALSFAGWGCGAEGDDTATRSTVQGLVTAESGVPGGSEEFVVVVSHEDTVSPDEARRLVANVRVRHARPELAGTPAIHTEGVLRPANLHWMVPEDHDVGVQVVPVDPDVDQDQFEWAWADEAIVAPHCPGGSHNLGL